MQCLLLRDLMYRIRKVLNHNAIIVLAPEEKREYLILGRGVGFGRKTAERVDTRPEDTVYCLQQTSERGSATEIVRSVNPECLEIAGAVLDEAAKVFGNIDRKILFPMADHLDFAVRRLRNGEAIRNPLNQDIQIMFHSEYKVALCAVPMLRRAFQIEISEDEIGFLALHVHTAIEDEKVSEALQTAQLVRFCISTIEQETGQSIEIMSLGYNRMMNHIRYMVTRILTKETLQMNLNDYMKHTYPSSYAIAAKVCSELGRMMKRTVQEAEIGYLAMHIERVIEPVPPSES